MFEIRSLIGYLAVSAALHVAILFSSHVKIAPTALSAGQGVQTPLTATISSRLPAKPETALAGAKILPTKQTVEDKQRTGEHPDVADQPDAMAGDREDSPVVELSIDDYLPPSLLDKIPTPEGDVDMNIDFKGMDGIIGDAEIMILISSQGDVDGVLVTGTNLPEFVVDQAVARFSEQKFIPGEVNGIQVRSRVRIRLTPPSRDELLMNPYSAKQRAWRR